MRRLTRVVAALALAGAPVLGTIAAGHLDGLMADNGVIHGNGVGAPGTVRVLADNGVISSRD